jgi:hypothetical protein
MFARPLHEKHSALIKDANSALAHSFSSFQATSFGSISHEVDGEGLEIDDHAESSP